VVETKQTTARDYTDLVRVTVNGERVAGTTLGQRNRPHLLEAWGQRFNVQLEEHVTLFRYRDLPGMIGRVGTCFGQHDINISSAAVGRQVDEPGDGVAAMVVTTDAPVPRDVVDEIVASEGFEEGRTVSLT
jgi:D-3-phosphoglycerate dehydrogenase